MSICNCNQGRLPCTCKPIEGATVMSEVIKFFAGDDFSGELCVYAADFDRVTTERDALQERLNAADQKDDDQAFQLKDREGSRRDWFDEAQRLQAELAERDALLCQSKGLLKVSAERLPRKHQTIREHIDHLRDEIEAALSASAEPSAPVERDEHAMRKAFKSWELNKDGPAVGVMPPEDAALDGFIAGADWQSNRVAEG